MTDETPPNASNPEPTNVDLDELAAAVTFVDGLVKDLEAIRNVQLNAKIVPEMGNQADLDTPFGRFGDAQTLWANAKEATEAIRTRLGGLSEQLGYLKSGTETIAANYRSAEERNAIGSHQVEALLDPEPDPTPTRTATTKATSAPTTTANTTAA